MCFTIRNGLQAKFGPKIEVVFSKNDTPLERKGRFTNLEELEREARQYGESCEQRDKAKDSNRLITSGEALRPQKQRITTVRWPLLGTPGRPQEDPKGVPLGHRGGRQNKATQKARAP